MIDRTFLLPKWGSNLAVGSHNKRLVVREVNAAIVELEERFGRNGHLSVLCECGAPGCLQRLEVGTAFYEEVRADMQRFIVAPGHAAERNDRVLADEAQYLIVAAERRQRAADEPALA